MKIKRRHLRSALKATGKIAKKSRPLLVAATPVIIDVVTELVPGSKLVKVAAKVGKAGLKR